MRVIVLTHGDAAPLLERLAALDEVAVAGVFVETDIVRRRSLAEKIRRSIRYEGCLRTMAKPVRAIARRAAVLIGRVVPGSRAHATNAPAPADGRRVRDIPVHRVARYDDDASLARMREAQADLAISWGTGILPPAVFELPRLGTINLHQGHTPFYRGGPSVFWELFNAEPQVGLTIHYVAAAVDAGDVVLQQLVPLTYDYDRFGTRFEAFLDEIRTELRARGADLMVEAVRRIANGTATRERQDISLGRRYRLPTRVEQDALRRKLRQRFGRTPRRNVLRKAPLGSP
jgi:folate-dependent phosphoribosylglycinamide formyltransferase PurN